MQEVYRINTIPGYKPWRGNGEYFLDKDTFDLVRKIIDDHGGDLYGVPAPGVILDADGELLCDEDSLTEWMYHKQIKDVDYPYILMGEETYYTE